MESNFYIEVNMKTAGGFERYGCFELGKDREFALRLFAGMAGSSAAQETDMLHFDLVEKRGGLPMSMHVLSCTVEQLAFNLKYLTRELFKRLNLDGSLP